MYEVIDVQNKLHRTLFIAVLSVILIGAAIFLGGHLARIYSQSRNITIADNQMGIMFQDDVFLGFITVGEHELDRDIEVFTWDYDELLSSFDIEFLQQLYDVYNELGYSAAYDIVVASYITRASMNADSVISTITYYFLTQYIIGNSSVL